MAVSRGNFAESTTSNASSKTVAITVGAGSDQALVVRTYISANVNVSSVVFNTSESLSLISRYQMAAGAGNVKLETWALKAPTQTTANVVVTWGGTDRVHAAVNVLNDVDQTTLNDAVQEASGEDGNGSDAVTCPTDGLILAHAGSFGGIANSTSGTEEFETASGGDYVHGGQYKSDSGNVTFGFDGGEPWAMQSVPFRPAAEAPAATSPAWQGSPGGWW